MKRCFRNVLGLVSPITPDHVSLGSVRCFSAKIYAPPANVDQQFLSFNELRRNVFEEINNYEKIAGVKWKRFPALTKLLLGHRKGELTLLTGPTGSGKTTFVSEYSLDLCMQGVKTLWGSFEIQNARLARIMLTQYAGKRLEENIHDFNYWANEFEKLPLFFLNYHGPQTFNRVLQVIRHVCTSHGINHVVVDNLQFMLGLPDTNIRDRFMQQDVVIGAIRKFCTEYNVHVTLVVHPRKEVEQNDLTNSSIFGGVKATQEADNILIIQDRRLSSPRGKQFLQVTKNRFSGDLGMFPLEFDKQNCSFSKKFSKTVTRSSTEEAQRAVN